MKNKYGFCKGLAALVLLMLCALTIKDNAYAQTAKTYKVLFIGNSHTYYNDMPLMAAKKARAAGYDCEVTMIAHGGWFLAQHVAEPDVRFDILFGNYDYVILQSMRIRLDRRRSFSMRRGN